MKFNTYSHNTNDLGALIRYSVPTACEIPLATLKERLDEVGLGAFLPRKRAYSDALRLAFGRIMEQSVRENGDGSLTSYVIDQVPRRKEDDVQRWAVHRQTRNRDAQVVAYEEVGYAILYDNGGLTVPPVLMDVTDVYAQVNRFIDNADHSKIRDTIRKIVETVAKPIPLNGISFITSDRVPFLKSRVEPVFNNLPAGEVAFSLYEIANTPQNVATLKQEVTASIADEIDKIKAGIVKAKTDSDSLLKSTVAEWLKTIDTLKANMEAMGVLNVTLPESIDDLEIQVAAIKAEVEKPKSKRRLHALA